MKALKDNAKNKIENSLLNAKLSKLNRAIKYNNALADNEEKEIDNTKKEGKVLRRYSLIASIISALTTCFSLLNDGEKIYLEIFIFNCLAILCACFIANKLVNIIVKYMRDFFDKKNKINIFTISMSLMIIIGYNIYSISTNLTFWSRYFTGAAVIMFSYIYDFSSIVFSLKSYDFLSLNFNDKKEEKINEPLKEEKTNEQSEEKTNDSNVVNINKDNTNIA